MTIKSNLSQRDMGNPLTAPGDRVELPFAHLRLYWHNGYPQAEKTGAKYFGGWFCGADDFVNDLALLGKSDAPYGFTGPETWTSRDSKDYSTYSARAVYAAPIVTRLNWIKRLDGGQASHLGILVYLATVENKVLVPYGPAVLYAKSYSAKYVQDAFKQWVSDTAQIRADVAPGVPVSMFYVPVGTFGDKRTQESVGKLQTSPIVPCQYGKQGQWNEKTLEGHFVGDEIGAAMLELKAQAEEWLRDKPANNDEMAGVRQPSAMEEVDRINAELSGSDEFQY
jgi:hypothetical protein